MKKTKISPVDTAAKSEFKQDDQKDLDTIASVKMGDANAFAHIVHRYEDVLLMRITSAVKDQHEAKDILQEIFIKVFQNISAYEKQFTFNAWITKVARNYVIDVVRKKNRENLTINMLHLDAAFGNGTGESPDFVYEIPDTKASSDEESYEVSHKKDFDSLTYLMKKLKTQERSILEMYYLQDKKQSEISAALNINHNTVRVKLLRLKKLLYKRAGKEKLNILNVSA